MIFAHTESEVIQMTIKCHLNITPSKECHEVCVQSRKCEALKIWESEVKQMELKPCPFCGSMKIYVNGDKKYWIACGSCGAEGPTPNRLWDCAENAIEEWNKRVGEADD